MIWPFQKKMTVDYCASLIATAIREDINVYSKAIRNHAGENTTDEQIESLEPELWAVELSVLEVVLSLTKFPTDMSRKLVPMLVVGYSPLDKSSYVARMQYYARAVAAVPSDQFAVVVGKTFVAASGIHYRMEKKDVNRAALEWAIGTVVVGSLQGLCEYTAGILKEHRIY